jgi:hypothetical protein
VSQSHGSAAVVKLDDSAGSITDISAYIDSGEMQRMRDKAETTTLGLAAKTFIQGLLDATFSVKGKFEVAIDAILYDALVCAAGTYKTLEYFPQGNSTGKVKYSFECFCTSYPVPFDVNSELSMSATFQCTGNVTRSVV